MSTGLYLVSGDWGNYASKVVRDDGTSTVIRNIAIPYTGSDDQLHALTAFSNGHAQANGSEPTDSVRFIFGDQEWLVGEMAQDVSLSKANSVTSYSRYGTPEWFAGIAASFAQLYGKRSGSIALTYSMPVSQFRAGRKAEIEEMLVGQWVMEYEGRQLAYDVLEEEIDGVPEGFGSLAYAALAESGKRWENRDLAQGRVALFDFGGYTLDVLTFENMRPGAYNESLTTGLINVRNNVERELKRRYNRPDVLDKVLDQVIRSGFYKHAGGPPENVKDIVDAALVGLMKDAMRVWREDLGGGVDYDTVLITGGGGPVIGELLKPQLGHRNVQVIPAGQAHLANALGALRFRKFKREMARLQTAG